MPAPLLLVICIIGFTVFVIVIETIVTSIKNIVTSVCQEGDQVRFGSRQTITKPQYNTILTGPSNPLFRNKRLALEALTIMGDE